MRHDGLQEEKLTVGQQVWVVETWRREVEEKLGTVVKIGRTLATVESGKQWVHMQQYYMETGQEKSQFSGHGHILTLAQKEERDRRRAALAAIKEAGLEPRGYGQIHIPTSKLEAVAAALADL